MKRRIKLALYLFIMFLGWGSVIVSLIIEVKYFDRHAIWLCLLGAGWTLISGLIAAFGLIGAFNTFNEKEPRREKRTYSNIHGKRMAFKDKEKYIKLEDIKQFLLTTSTPEKIYILSENDIYCSFEVYMENKGSYYLVADYDLDTRQFFIDEKRYKDINEATEYLKNNRFVLKDECVCVIGYEYSSPYYLQKRIEDKE